MHGDDAMEGRALEDAVVDAGSGRGMYLVGSRWHVLIGNTVPGSSAKSSANEPPNPPKFGQGSAKSPNCSKTGTPKDVCTRAYTAQNKSVSRR